MFFLWRNTSKKTPPPPPQGRTNIGGLPVSVRSSPIVGDRIWRVASTVDGLVLASVNMGYEWETTNTARCMVQQTANPIAAMAMKVPAPHETAAPGVECSCGFYSILPGQSLDEWSHLVSGRVYAAGQVALSGRVIRCTMGYKAEHAEILSPVHLHVTCASSKACANPVAVVDLQASYGRGWCHEHAPGEGAVIEVGSYMREVSRQLTGKYGREFGYEHPHG